MLNGTTVGVLPCPALRSRSTLVGQSREVLVSGLLVVAVTVLIVMGRRPDRDLAIGAMCCMRCNSR